MTDGILLLDKPGGITSHDVVARARRGLNTRKIGHAGTLDPMATGLLILGVGSATRLLTFLVGLDKTYTATMRLGAATATDDADGDVIERADAATVAALTGEGIAAAVGDLTGVIAQVPSRVSAIKVGGRRAYDLVRAGQDVELAARQVTVTRFAIVEQRATNGCLDLDVVVDCTSGTYVRALARDLGAALGVGGHLTSLRRTRIGPFRIEDAASLDDIAVAVLAAPGDIAVNVLGRLDVTAEEARDLRQGKRLTGAAARVAGTRAAAIDPDGELVGIVEPRDGDIKSAMNMPGERRP